MHTGSDHDNARAAMRMKTAGRVRSLRHAHGFSATELARRAGIPRSYVYDLEAGQRVTVRNITAVAPVLHASTDYLLGLTDEDPRFHACCKFAAERDVWRRVADDLMVRFPDGSWRAVRGILDRSVLEEVTGEPLELVTCGVYEFRGQRFRIGSDEPLKPGGGERRAGVTYEEGRATPLVTRGAVRWKS